MFLAQRVFLRVSKWAEKKIVPNIFVVIYVFLDSLLVKYGISLTSNIRAVYLKLYLSSTPS